LLCSSWFFANPGMLLQHIGLGMAAVFIGIMMVVHSRM
jgi:hypothetical protein